MKQTKLRASRKVTAVLASAILLETVVVRSGAAPVIALNTDTGAANGVPVVVRHTGGYSNYAEGMTMNRVTGTLYFGATSNGGREVHKIDSTVTKLKSAANATANDAGMGAVRHYESKYYRGSVASGTAVSSGYSTSWPTWNPNTGTLMLAYGDTGVYSKIGVDEILPQTSSEGLGVLNEGISTAAGGPSVTQAAIASHTTSASLDNKYGQSNGGQAYVDRVTIGGTDYDRVFRSQGKVGDNSPGKWILLAQMSDQINGWDATTVGSRTTLQPHNNNAASATLLDMAACGALVDVASDEYIADLAVYDNMLFILSQSATTTNTYVSAVTYDLPTDGSTAVSVTGVVDLDPNSSADYLVLDDLFDAPYDIKGRGIEFGADSGDTTMYVASNDGLIYTFKVAAASPSSGTVIMIH